ncbi:MAG: UDP-N-acetylmuramate dehydrogenase [Lachnospiraceae bacterium]|nr:UDP-N-acetylmuramate dehydrogenase [Lachnospiraceae bacterium]
MQNIYELLCGCAGGENVRRQEPMSLHTTFRIGGPADLFVMPGSIQAVADSIRICKETQTPYAVIGNGSNLLVSDAGYRGVIIQIGRNLNQITGNGEEIRAQAGAMLSVIAKTALSESLTGFEFASGIPGTLGGAVVMNAGAYGGEMKDVLTEVTVLTREGEIRTIPAEKLELGYRTSLAAKNGWIILEAVLRFQKGDAEAIRSRMEELKVQRVTKQPLDLPSAGSTFKRPEGYFAGKLIMDAGLRGFTVGGAQISEKHCGFVVNKGGATAEDVRNLICAVQKKVQEDAGVKLEPEVKFLGEFHSF